MYVELNRPEVHNAFNAEMILEVTGVFRDANSKDIRSIVLVGAGKSFCAGADLNWMKSMAGFSIEENRADAEALYNLFEAGACLEVPLIAKIQGSVFGGGLGLVAVSDIVAAETQSQFCFSEVKLGLVPAVISPFVLKKSRKNLCQQYMITGEVFGAVEAKDLGIVNFVGTAEQTEAFVTEKVKQIQNNGPQAVRELKGLLRFQESGDREEIRRQTVAVIAERRVSPEGQEGLTSFFEKRKPRWIL